MNLNPKPIRIEAAFEDREQIRAMFMRNAPYRALAAYAPEGVKDETREEDKKPLLPWFRGDWALDGKPLVEEAETNPAQQEVCRGCEGRLRHIARES